MAINGANDSVWQQALDRQREDQERVEREHNVQITALSDQLNRIRDEKQMAEVTLHRQAAELTEAQTLITEMQRALIDVDTARLAHEAEREVRSRAKCDRWVQCNIASPIPSPCSPVRGSFSPPRALNASTSHFLSLAQQERDRTARNPTTTALTQTDPVVFADAHLSTQCFVPSLDFTRSLSPEAAVALTGRGVLPDTAREAFVLASQRSTDHQLTSRIALSDTVRASDLVELSPEVNRRDAPSEIVSLRVSRSPGAVLQLTNDLPVCPEDPRIDSFEEIPLADVLTSVKHSSVVSSCVAADACVGTDFVQVGVAVDTHPAEPVFVTTEVGLSGLSVFRSHAISKGCSVAERLSDLFFTLKSEVDQDGHFAAVFLTGLVASFMFSR